jgi:hypothetical protein
LAETQNTNHINVEKLAAGIYIIQVFADKIYQAKFIKE